MEFIDYALIWWDQLLISRRRTGEGPGLKQGNRSVEDYFKEMEIAMMRAKIEEDRDATMAQFMNGLNTEIANVVELQHYVELDEMVHMAIRVERQQRRRIVSTRAETSKLKPPVAEVGRGKQSMHPECTRDIQCFKCLGRGHVASQCPNRRTMLMLESGKIESESEEDEQEFPKETVQEEDDTLQSFETEEALVIKRSLTTQPTQDNQQRENIFHTRCLVNGKVCVVIIDGGSCTSIASSIMVEKLGLATTKHPNPYRLQWLNDGGAIKVTKQVLVPFTIGKYKDEDGVTNWYSFTPLTPSQVQENQVIREIKGKKRMNIYASNRDIRKCLSSQQSILVLLFKDHCLMAEIPAGERTCAQGLMLSSVEAWELVCSSFQLHKADTLQLAHFSSSQLNFSSRSSTQAEQPSGERTRIQELKPSSVEARSLYAARFSSMKLTHLQLAHFSSSKLRERTRIQELKPSSVEARSLYAARFSSTKLTHASSFQLIEAPFSLTSALLAQLKLNNPEVAQRCLTCGRVSYKHVAAWWTSKHVCVHVCGRLIQFKFPSFASMGGIFKARSVFSLNLNN
ncbi:hypothetical protein GQ457_04G020030 [Hibiscus cannabinus]